MYDKEYQHLLEDYYNLAMDLEKLSYNHMLLKDLINRIRRFYPGQFEECATLDELKLLEE